MKRYNEHWVLIDLHHFKNVQGNALTCWACVTSVPNIQSLMSSLAIYNWQPTKPLTMVLFALDLKKVFLQLKSWKGTLFDSAPEFFITIFKVKRDKFFLRHSSHTNISSLTLNHCAKIINIQIFVHKERNCVKCQSLWKRLQYKS